MEVYSIAAQLWLGSGAVVFRLAYSSSCQNGKPGYTTGWLGANGPQSCLARCAVTIAYTFGWRIQSEVLPLQLSQIDREAGSIRLEPGTTKNRDRHTVYMTPEIDLMMGEQIERVKPLPASLGESSQPYSPIHGKDGSKDNACAISARPGRPHARRPDFTGMIGYDLRRPPLEI